MLCWDLWEVSPRKAGAKVGGYPGVEGSLSGLPGADLLPVWLAAGWSSGPHFSSRPAPQFYCPGLSSLAAQIGECSDSKASQLAGLGTQGNIHYAVPSSVLTSTSPILCCYCLRAVAAILS